MIGQDCSANYTPIYIGCHNFVCSCLVQAPLGVPEIMWADVFRPYHMFHHVELHFDGLLHGHHLRLIGFSTARVRILTDDASGTLCT